MACNGNGPAAQQPRNELTPYIPDKILLIEVYQLEPDVLSNSNKTASTTSSIPWRLCGKKVLNISKNKPLTLTEQVIVQDCINTVKTFPDVLIMPHPNDGCALIRDNNAALLLQQKKNEGKAITQKRTHARAGRFKPFPPSLASYGSALAGSEGVTIKVLLWELQGRDRAVRDVERMMEWFDET